MFFGLENTMALLYPTYVRTREHDDDDDDDNDYVDACDGNDEQIPRNHRHSH